MTMNLLTDPWIPVRTADGPRRISPAELPSSGALAPASPRADFDAAIHEFLIGLLQSCCGPKDEFEWEDWFEEPPTEGELAERLGPFASAFQLDHPEHPFLQETGLADPKERCAVVDLLIDTPGAATVKDNKDHFVKRRSEGVLCGPCTALGLLTLQSFSPAGGRGNMTSIRGGGPISSVLVAADLWSTVWANVLPASTFGAKALTAPTPDAFPWLKPADAPMGKRAKVYANNVHPAHVFWGMPRRILLAAPTRGASCALCGEQAGGAYAAYFSRPYGFDYQGSWRHPLTPTQENKGETSARKGSSELGGYRQWVGLVAASSEGTRRPALVVHHYRAGRWRSLDGARMRAAGFAMDNAKVEGWYEGTIRHLLPGDEDVRRRVDAHAQTLVESTADAAGLLRTAYKEAWYDRPRDVKGDLGHVTSPLWSRTESAFYASLEAVAADVTAAKAERLRWWDRLRGETLSLFDFHVQYTRLGDADPQRVVQAENKLRALLRRSLPKTLDLTPEDIVPEMIV